MINLHDALSAINYFCAIQVLCICLSCDRKGSRSDWPTDVWKRKYVSKRSGSSFYPHVGLAMVMGGWMQSGTVIGILKCRLGYLGYLTPVSRKDGLCYVDTAMDWMAWMRGFISLTRGNLPPWTRLDIRVKAHTAISLQPWMKMPMTAATEDTMTQEYPLILCDPFGWLLEWKGGWKFESRKAGLDYQHYCIKMLLFLLFLLSYCIQ